MQNLIASLKKSLGGKVGKLIHILGGGLLIVTLLGLSLMMKNHRDYQANILPAVLVEMTNENRLANHLNELKVSPVLEQAAKLKAEDMAKNSYFAHTSPDGKTPWFWFQEAGYAYLYAGENLAVNFNDNAAVTQAWLNSVRHRENILSKNYSEIGIATAEGNYKGNKSTFIVVMLGVPLPSMKTIGLK